MQVTQIFMNCIEELSTVRIFMPKDLRPAPNRTTVEKTVDEVVKRYNGEVPCLDPKKDLKVGLTWRSERQINDETFDKLVTNFDRLNGRMKALNVDATTDANTEAYKQYERKMELTEELSSRKKDLQKSKELVLMVSERIVSDVQETLQKMKRVLRRLGYIDDADVVQEKGRVACEINSADELLITELIYDGVFIDLDPKQCVALLAAITFQEKVGVDKRDDD